MEKATSSSSSSSSSDSSEGEGNSVPSHQNHILNYTADTTHQKIEREESVSTTGSGKQSPFRQRVIKEHSNTIVLQLLFLPVLPLVLVLTHAILWPGPLYCSYESCPQRLTPYIPDAVMVPLVLSVLVLGSSGAWMAKAFRNKVVAITVLFFVATSLLQLLGPVFYRGYVLPYSSVQPYNISVTASGPQRASLAVREFWSQYYDVGNEGGEGRGGEERTVLVQVHQVNGDEESLQDISPFATLLFQDNKFEETTTVMEGVQIERVVEGLQAGEWYMWSIIPAYEAASLAQVGNFLHEVEKVELSDGRSYKNAYIDLRGWKLCQWDPQAGCH